MEPKNLASLWLSYAPTSTTHLDLIGRYVDNLTQIQVKSYTELTARLSYQVSPHIELSLSGYNLLDSAHREYQSTFVKLVPTEIRRSVFTEAKITF